MERTMSVEDKIRRAEEIYARRQGEYTRPARTITEEKKEDKKDVRLLRKMIWQIVICMIIYGAFYVIQNNEFFFSKEFIQKAEQVLSYDTNFNEVWGKVQMGWEGLVQTVNGILPKTDEQNKEENKDENSEQKEGNQDQSQNQEEASIGGAVEGTEGGDPELANQNPEDQGKLSEEDQDVEAVKKTTSFIKPIEGSITSHYGHREPTTSTVPKNHTGTDIGAAMGTKIKAATEGEVVLASEEGDYGKHLKIQIGEVSIIYAHCSQLLVKQGDKIVQGQEIAEVGSTGNSTGPHLHFEVRYQERTLDPEKILALN